MTGHVASEICIERANIFAVLGSPCRLEIVELLAAGSCKPLDLSSRLRITRPAVSRHLKILRKVGLVSREVTGHGVLFRLTPAATVASITGYAAGLDHSQPEAGIDDRDPSIVRSTLRREQSATGCRELAAASLVAANLKDTANGRARLRASSDAWNSRADDLAMGELEIANRPEVANPNGVVSAPTRRVRK